MLFFVALKVHTESRRNILKKIPFIQYIFYIYRISKQDIIIIKKAIRIVIY